MTKKEKKMEKELKKIRKMEKRCKNMGPGCVPRPVGYQ